MLNQEYRGSYPPEVAVWCNNNNAYIKEVEPKVYMVLPIPEPTQEELDYQSIQEAQQYLTETDYIALKLAEFATNKLIYDELLIKYEVQLEKRRECREIIDRLREELANV